VGGELSDVSALEGDLTFIRRRNAGDKVDQRRFPGTIWADEAENLSGIEVKGYFVSRDHAAEAFGYFT